MCDGVCVWRLWPGKCGHKPDKHDAPQIGYHPKATEATSQGGLSGLGAAEVERTEGLGGASVQGEDSLRASGGVPTEGGGDAVLRLPAKAVPPGLGG